MMNFERLQTPQHDGDVLVEPATTSWAQLIERNIHSRTTEQAGLELAGVPIDVVRQQTRAKIVDAYLPHSPSTSHISPIIACGHQPEFVHPGVWAKHVVVHHVAQQLGMLGIDLVVDHDVPRSTTLAIPTLHNKLHDHLLSIRHVPVLSGTAGVTYESRAALSANDVEHLTHELEPHDPSMMNTYCRELAQFASQSENSSADFVDQHLAARECVDRSLAATLFEVRVSRTFGGPFVTDILLNIDRFASAYNESLAEYQRQQQIRQPDRPLPSLKRDGDRFETPFWIYQPGQPRQRLWIASHGDTLELWAGVGSQAVGTLSRADLLREPSDTILKTLSPWVIQPRALTLTLWARLLACDLFVHGIGGAKYDRITDDILRRYYQCKPPAYACVSATLRLPLPHHNVTAADEWAARRRLRECQFNPQRYLQPPTDSPSRQQLAELLAERERLIAESRRLHEQQGSRLERRTVFNHLREINALIAHLDPTLQVRLQRDLDRLSQQRASNAIADRRDFFYALQPRDRLEQLARCLIRAVPL